MELTLLVMIVTSAVVMMLPRIKRVTQSVIKSAADQIGDQKNAEQTFSNKDGYLVETWSKAQTVINNFREERPGNMRQRYNEVTTTNTSSSSLGGWSADE